MRAFIDTNVLIYAVADDSEKSARAREVLRQAQVTSVQVLNEFASVARRKLGRSVADIRLAEMHVRAVLEVMPITLAQHDSALDIAERYGFGFYDALIVASALDAGCDRLWTEDLQHGQWVGDRLHILNPFTTTL